MTTPSTMQGGSNRHPVNIVTWNVRGLGGPIKRCKVLSHLKSLSTDIAFLQETHLCREDHVRLRKPWVGQIFHSNFNSKSRGVAILIHKRIRFSPDQIHSDPYGRYIIVSGLLFETPVVFANLYAPNCDSPSFMSNVFSQLPNLHTHKLILGGDLNCTTSPIDRSQSKTGMPSAMSKTLTTFMEQIGCVDPWRFLHPSAKDFSYYSAVHKVFSRIDYFFIDKTLLPFLSKAQYSAIVISDHAPHILGLCLPSSSPRHQGGWRLNSSLLADSDFCNHVSTNINVFLEMNRSEQVSPSLLWETLKAYIRGCIISYSTHLAKSRKLKQQELTDAIIDIDRQQAITITPDLTAKRLQLQTEFDLLSTGKAEYLLQRTRATYYEHGDRAGRLLASQLRHQCASRFISQIYDASHNLTTDPASINSAFSSFYSTLYKSEPPSDSLSMDSFLDNLEFPSLSEDLSGSLEEPLELKEITSCISQMRSHKAPGPDGYPVEFFKKFSTQLAPLLLDVYNDSLEQGVLPPTLNQALISLILKKDKDPNLCGSYRPISLLNNDVKILAKVLARRLETCLPNIISEDQTGFILGRQLSSSVRRLLNVVLSPSASPTPEMIVSLDAERAFDRVEFKYLFSVLHKFGFGTKFISWIRLLYSAPMASVKTNSDISLPFPLTRGTRQGCPLSPLLFALAVEPLSIALKSCPHFSGIIRGGLEHRVSLYADDLLLYILDPLNCIDKIVDLLKLFGTFSGYKLNIAKSLCFPVNQSAKLIPPGTLPFQFSPSGFKYLGVNISHSLSSLHKNNFMKLFENIKTDLQRWHALPISLIGRIETIKMNILPRILFLFQTLPLFLPKSFFKSLDTIISSFIWTGKIPRIQKRMLERPKLVGGFALPNMLLYYWAANIQMLKKWYHHPDINWCVIEANSCTTSSLPALLFAPLSTRPSQHTNNPVVLSSLKIWKQFRHHFGLKSPSVFLPICNNHLFLPSSIDQTFMRWRNVGVVSFNDLYSGNSFVSFADLVKKCGISNHDLFRYFQLRNFTKAQFSSFPTLPERTLIEDIMFSSVFNSRISSIHNLLLSSQQSPLLGLKDTWERELGLPLDEFWWTDVLARINTTCICARMSLIQFKVVFRLHYTRARLKKLFPDADDLCIRCSHSPADHTHTFFTCPKLYAFWSSFFTTLSEVLNIQISPCPLIAIFGVSPVLGKFNSYQADVIAFAALIAKRQILLHWKSPKPPGSCSWFRELLSFLHLEKIKHTVRGSLKTFHKTWDSLLSYDPQNINQVSDNED